MCSVSCRARWCCALCWRALVNVVSLALRAACNATPLVVAACRRAVPSPCRCATVLSTANCALCQRDNPSTMTLMRRPSSGVKSSHIPITDEPVQTHTSACLPTHLSSRPLHKVQPNTPAPSSRRPHRPHGKKEGANVHANWSGRKRRLHNHTRNGYGSTRVARAVSANARVGSGKVGHTCLLRCRSSKHRAARCCHPRFGSVGSASGSNTGRPNSSTMERPTQHLPTALDSASL